MHGNVRTWIRLKSDFHEDDIVLANVCAPNKLLYRCDKWEELHRFLPRNKKWILGGDFNFVINHLCMAG